MQGREVHVILPGKPAGNRAELIPRSRYQKNKEVGLKM
jgi:hypothetical protein